MRYEAALTVGLELPWRQ